MKWTKVSKEVIDKAPEIIPLKKGELQVKYAKLLVKVDKAINYTKRHFKGMVADEEAQELLSILQDEEVK